MDHSAWDARYAGSELVWTAEPNRFLVQETAELPTGRALDLACGEGRNAIWLAERGWRVTGVDFSAVGLEKAGRAARKRRVEVEWICADVLTFTPSAGAYDLVIVFYLQLPADERRAIIRATADRVAPGGTLLLVAHDSANLADGYGGPQTPSVLYTAEDVTGDLDGAGLTIERAERVPRPVATADGERIALDVLVRARRT